jgi:WD40 repeat protein
MHNLDEPTSSLGALGQFSPDSRLVGVTGIHPQSKSSPFVRQVERFFRVRLGAVCEPVTRVWNVETGTELCALGGCTKMLFSPDSKSVAGLYENGTIRLWDLHFKAPISRILVSAVGVWLLIFLGARGWCKWRGRKTKSACSDKDLMPGMNTGT